MMKSGKQKKGLILFSIFIIRSFDYGCEISPESDRRCHIK